MLARQKEKALGSMNEVVQTVKHPRSHMNEKEEYPYIDLMHLKPVEAGSTNTPGRQTPQLMAKSDPYLGSSTQDSKSNSRKSQNATSVE